MADEEDGKSAAQRIADDFIERNRDALDRLAREDHDNGSASEEETR